MGLKLSWLLVVITIIAFLFLLTQAYSQTQAPDGNWVGGSPRQAPDGSWVGVSPRQAPDGSWVGVP
tara:strand:- start:3684 stop:3881 length:198 start_codon:yes stop_codon:yes gene_type:complete